jgi:hypothetical protein
MILAQVLQFPFTNFNSVFKETFFPNDEIYQISGRIDTMIAVNKYKTFNLHIFDLFI